ncbi:MAG: ATP-binding protein [Candidatus Zixiibacteriota bacterium]
MSTAGTRRGSARLRPRARIVRTIGRDLISNEIVALVELIKNAYDADASAVRILFEEPLQPAQGGILIDDNGTGMSLDVVRKAWFEPATTSKTRKTHTPSGRRVTGEKGIGRFAAARIAQTLEMTTVAIRSRQLVRVRFDWGLFDDENLYLDQVRFRWEQSRAPKERQHGTTLHLIGLNDAWDAPDFARLRAELSRLVSPQEAHSEFNIVLELPDRFEEYAGQVMPPPILGKPHYMLQGRIDGQGRFKASYRSGDSSALTIESGRVLLEKGRVPECGPFRFEFRVWDRDRSGLDPLADELGSTVRQLRKDLDAASGISIYRDDFRILLGDNDWLRLDLRRVQNPTMRLSNNQVVGAVFISAETNKGLRDQTNREGIVSSPAFEDFKRTMIELLSRLEIKRDSSRRAHRSTEPTTGIFQDLDIKPIREFLEKRYPNDRELQTFIEGRSKNFEHGVVQVQQVLARYRRLATLGQLIDVVLHDGRTPVATISNEAVLGVRDLQRTVHGSAPGTLQGRFQTISQQAEVLSSLFRRLAPFSGRKRGRPVAVAIEKLIGESFDLLGKRISDLQVDVQLPEGSTMVTVDETEMKQIFVNLLDNALYWLEKVPESARMIAVKVIRRTDELVVLFSDSGPGVPEDIRDRIFEPYFSAKPDGVGLGLTIAGETAAEYNGMLELVEGGPLPGATFRTILRKRLGGGDA